MATPKIKNMVIGNISEDLSCGIDVAIATLQRCKAHYEAEGYTDLEIDIDTYCEYGDTYARAELSGTRMETEQEAAHRENLEFHAARDADARARKQYEALKAKFG